ncbi:uncharacterized protein [Arachis hypogaea]|uniref:uncharacterized protein n=1 Tax=Arachis hypogaea TaxID=3818 RepID=UPI003B21446D
MNEGARRNQGGLLRKEKPPDSLPEYMGNADSNSSRHENDVIGAGGKTFPALIKDIKREYNASFCILLETHISGDRGRTVCKKLGFDNFYIEDARGFSGGIWCIWDNSAWNVDITFHSSQMVHMELKQGQSPPWFLSAIYGTPQKASRRALWNEIRDLSSNINQPWCLIGDFNAILNDFERKGSIGSNSRGACSEFQTCISDCGLFDLGYCGWLFPGKGVT